MNLHTANNKFWEMNNDFIPPEAGGGGGGGSSDSLLLRVDRVEGSTSYFDHTWQEVYDALEIGKRCVFVLPFSIEDSSGIEIDEIWTAYIQTEDNNNMYIVNGGSELGRRNYEADNANSPLYYDLPY